MATKKSAKKSKGSSRGKKLSGAKKMKDVKPLTQWIKASFD
jgi:hypothetical protein